MELEQILPPQLDIYRASAGSGKTFLLTKQYLKLLVGNPFSYRSILAVTFTNKATDEMKHRILSELKKLAMGNETQYGAVLQQEVKGLSAEKLQTQAELAYTSILHHYSQFSISTIDSFVQKIIRSFAYEIGLDAGFKLQLDTDVVKDDLTARLYRLLDTDQNLLDWVVEMASQRLGEGKNWDFKKDMLELAAELFKERFQQFDKAMLNIPDEERTNAFRELRNKVFASKNHFEKTLVGIALQAIELLQNNGLDHSHFAYGKAGFINHFYKHAVKDCCPPGKRVLDVLEDIEKMTTKSAPAATKAAVKAISQQLHGFLRQLVDYYEANVAQFYTAKAISTNLYTLQLMQVFSKELANYRAENNALLISDTHLLLRQLTADNEATFIFEKTGNRYLHFLIDEFQDTSNFQWDNFRPLLENSLAQAEYNLIVGDVKQAIYRWRSGDWRLLLSQVKKDLRQYQIHNDTLQDNYRSATPIIDFNNFLFSAAPQLLQEKFNLQMEEAPLDLQEQLEAANFKYLIAEAYKDSFQHVPKHNTSKGLVEIQFFGEQENEDGETINFTDVVLRELPITIERLLVEKSYQPKDITILTRGNYEARLVIQTLMQHQQNEGAIQYDLLSAEALLLAANPSVQLLVAAMKYLVDENDLLSRALMVQNIAERFGTALPQHQWYASNGQGAELLPPKYYSNRIHLAGLPLVELASQLIDIFELNEVKNHQAYLLAFQDLIMERNRFGEDGLYGFLQYWEDEGTKKSLPAIGGGNAVEVMTVHKSKGLAFNVLIMPFCNWALEPDAKKNNWLWVKTENTPFGNVPVVPVKYQKDLAKSHFAYAYFEERLLAQMDALNLLYVAFTRAKSQIIAYAPLPKPTKDKEELKLNTVGDLLFASLVSSQWSMVSGKAPIDPQTIHYSPFTIHFGDAETQAGIASEIIGGIKLAKIHNNDWRQILGIRPSNFFVGEDIISLPRKRGTLLHEAMCLLQHPQELPMVLQQMKMKGLVDDLTAIEMQETLSKILTQPIFENWKTNTIQRFGEREIVGADQSLKRPDLVLMDENNTWVIDFKFGEKKDNSHHKQVKEYVQLLQQMEFNNVKGYLLYGMENQMVEVEL